MNQTAAQNVAATKVLKELLLFIRRHSAPTASTLPDALVPAIMLCFAVHDSSHCGLRKGRRLRVWPSSNNVLKPWKRASHRITPHVRIRVHATVYILRHRRVFSVAYIHCAKFVGDIPS
jgi:hypothetical protein